MSNSDNDESPLAPNQELAVTHLANGKTITETADLLGVSRQTIHNWIKDYTFAQQLKDLQREHVDEIAKRYSSAELESFEVRRTILLDETATNSDRLRAAKDISTTAIQYRETLDFQERLQKVEDTVKKQDGIA